MATDLNPLKAIEDLLKNNYLKNNTDNISPEIAKIYMKPKDKEPKAGEDFIYFYSQNTADTPFSIGAPELAEVEDSIKIDIRTKPRSGKIGAQLDDSHARKVLTEVKRILYSNIRNPGNGYDEIDKNMDLVDLSNGMRGIFRYVLTVNLKAFCNDFTQ